MEEKKDYVKSVEDHLTASESFVQSMDSPINALEWFGSTIAKGIITAVCVFGVGAGIDKFKEIRAMKKQ